MVYRPLQIALKLIKSLSMALFVLFKQALSLWQGLRAERLTNAANHHTE